MHHHVCTQKRPDNTTLQGFMNRQQYRQSRSSRSHKLVDSHLVTTCLYSDRETLATYLVVTKGAAEISRSMHGVLVRSMSYDGFIHM